MVGSAAAGPGKGANPILYGAALVFAGIIVYVIMKFQHMPVTRSGSSSLSSGGGGGGLLRQSPGVVGVRGASVHASAHTNEQGENILLINSDKSVIGITTTPNPLRNLMAAATKRGLEKKTITTRTISDPLSVPYMDSQVCTCSNSICRRPDK
jgi:hypothetical protein